MADERYAAFDGMDTSAVLQPTENSAVVASGRQQELPLFFVERLGDLVISRVVGAVTLCWRYLFASAVVFCKAVRYLWRKCCARFQTAKQRVPQDVADVHRDLSLLREGARRNKENRGWMLE